MIDGVPVIDAHVHAARASTMKLSWKVWTTGFGHVVPFAELYTADGALDPQAFDRYVAGRRRGCRSRVASVRVQPEGDGHPAGRGRLRGAWGAGHLPLRHERLPWRVYPGATNRWADPGLIDEVARNFGDLRIVLAHGGRGWWYDWPGAPGIRANVERLSALDLDADTIERILWRNAVEVYRNLPVSW